MKLFSELQRRIDSNQGKLMSFWTGIKKTQAALQPSCLLTDDPVIVFHCIPQPATTGTNRDAAESAPPPNAAGPAEPAPAVVTGAELSAVIPDLRQFFAETIDIVEADEDALDEEF